MTKNMMIILVAVVLLTCPIMVSCGQKQGDGQTESQSQSQAAGDAGATADNQNTGQSAAAETPSAEMPKFPGVEKQILNKLVSLWQQKGNLTSIDQAAKMIGVTVTDSMRLEMLKSLEEHMASIEKLGRYHPYTFVLTNSEKLVAQYLSDYEKLASEFPALKLIAEELKMSESEVSNHLKFLASAGYLYDLGGPDEFNKLGYSFGSKKSDFVYDMGLRFHVFYVDDQPAHNVGCAKEAFFLIANEYPKNKVRYTTIDPQTLEPVEVTFENTQVTSVSPDSAVYLDGGPCGSNNLFASREHAEIWQKSIPHLRAVDTQPITVRERMAEAMTQVMNQTGGK